MFKSLDEIKNELNKNKTVKFKIKVGANSKADAIDFCDDLIKIKVKAPKVEGKANKAVIEYLSGVIGVAKSKVNIVNGQKACIKTISIEL